MRIGPMTQLAAQIVAALADAVKHEKEHSLDHVTLHPDDPFVLLAWDCYDDLTPFIFLCNLESAFDLKVSHDAWSDVVALSSDWWANKCTVAVVVERCLGLLPPLTAHAR